MNWLDEYIEAFEVELAKELAPLEGLEWWMWNIRKECARA